MKSRVSLKASELKEELLSESSVPLLKELHLLTSQGQLNADARRKLKQVNHLYQLIAPALRDISTRFDEFQIVDVGSGKGYLGFILYDIALKESGRGQILSIESRGDLVKNSEDIAERLGFGRMKFVESKIEKAVLPERVHLVTALHACDTATDDALIVGVQKKADYLTVVPCCQAEVAQLLKNQKEGAVAELWRHGIHRREFGSHFTNVIRALVLESCGYSVTMTELVGWEHSLKNELIMAKRVQNENKTAKNQLEKLLKHIGVRPKIVRVLCDAQPA